MIRFLASLLFVALWLGQGADALAATSITITETQALTFPMVGLPSSGGTVNLAVSPLNSSTSGTGQIIKGFASRGSYNLATKGSGGISISIDISDAATGNGGLTLSNFRGFYNGSAIDSFPSTTLPLPNSHPSSSPLYIGATVTATSAVPVGSYNGSFTITVFVQ